MRRAREAKGLSQSALARRLSVRSQTINQWEHDKKSPSRDNIVAFAKETGADLVQLLYGEQGLRQTVTNVNVLPLGTRGRFVALVSTVRAATERELSAAQDLTYFAHYPCGPHSRAFNLPDDSNAPTYPEGTKWVVDPDQKPQPGDMVLGRFGADLEPIFGEYRIETTASGHVFLIAPLNPRWPAARSDLGPLEVFAVMTEFSAPARRTPR